jgi:hypothetical protein
MERGGRVRRLVVLAGITVAVLCTVAAPSLASAGQASGRLGDLVVLNGRTSVLPGQTAKNVVVFHGRTVVAGTVTGSVVVFDGVVRVSGDVRHSVVVFRGVVTVAAGAHIGGDLVTGDRPKVDPGARVDGKVKRVSSFRWSGYSFLSRFLVWLAFTVSVLILGLILVALAPGGLEAAASASRSLGATAGWGVALLVGLPLAAVLVTLTVVGIPLGLAMLLGLWLVFTVGYAVGAFVVGRWIVRPPAGRMKAFFAGWGVVRVLGLIPIVGGVLWTLVTIAGLGAAMVAVWRARRAARLVDTGERPPGPVAPPPPAPSTPPPSGPPLPAAPSAE